MKNQIKVPQSLQQDIKSISATNEVLCAVLPVTVSEGLNIQLLQSIS